MILLGKKHVKPFVKPVGQNKYQFLFRYKNGMLAMQLKSAAFSGHL